MRWMRRTTRDRAPRPETREREDHAAGCRQGAGLRPGADVRARQRGGRAVADDHGGDGPDRRHGGVPGPEQARGLPLDKRADVWAFGCVLYELLTGRLAFAAATVTDTLAAVLHQEPDWAALPAGCRRRSARCCDAAWRRTCGSASAVSATCAPSSTTRSRTPGGGTAVSCRPASALAATSSACGGRRRDRRCRARRMGESMAARSAGGSRGLRPALQANHRRCRHGGDAGGLA